MAVEQRRGLAATASAGAAEAATRGARPLTAAVCPTAPASVPNSPAPSTPKAGKLAPASVRNLQVTEQFTALSIAPTYEPSFAPRTSVTDLGAFPYP